MSSTKDTSGSSDLPTWMKGTLIGSETKRPLCTIARRKESLRKWSKSKKTLAITSTITSRPGTSKRWHSSSRVTRSSNNQRMFLTPATLKEKVQLHSLNSNLPQFGLESWCLEARSLSKATASQTSQWKWHMINPAQINSSLWQPPLMQEIWLAQTSSYSETPRSNMLSCSLSMELTLSTLMFQIKLLKMISLPMALIPIFSARTSKMSSFLCILHSKLLLVDWELRARFHSSNQRCQNTWRRPMLNSWDGLSIIPLKREKPKRLRLMRARSNQEITSLSWDLMVLTQWSCTELDLTLVIP